MTINWKKVKIGTPFTANISGKKVSGRIYKNSDGIWLCQNKLNGSDSPNKLEFNYSWYIDDGTPSDIEYNRVSNLVLGKIEKDYKFPEVIAISEHTVRFFNKHITVGCIKVSNATVRKITKLLKS